MGAFFDLHRHDEFSFFDGMGKAEDLAKHAKELGYPALGISNHGNMSGIIKHWKACKNEGIKPVFGCEVYFQPVFKKESPERKSYHLCLFVKNYTGYKNLCRILTVANTEQFYFNPIVDFKTLEKYSDGLICSTACVGGYLSQSYLNGNKKKGYKFIEKMLDIFGEDLYIEIQPYTIDEEGTQERVNLFLLNVAEKYDIKPILTSDSHYRARQDFDTYCKMHEIAKHSIEWVENTYSTRYMPSESEIVDRFVEMHEADIAGIYDLAEDMVNNMSVLLDSIDNDILEFCDMKMPKFHSKKSSNKILIDMTKEGLKKRGKYKKEYISRCVKELDTIHYHGFDDYFLMVQEYVNWARENDIAVGDGRGSACNCLVAYAIGITDVDSIKYKLDFSRFMRKEKKKMPDIDVDFETSRRGEVIQHVIESYSGQSVQICSYGEYGIDNLINDLAKVCGLPIDGDCKAYIRDMNKHEILEIKRFVHEREIDGVLNVERIKTDMYYHECNDRHDNILKHFLKLYKKVRNLGTHAAGVVVTGGNIEDYTCIIRRSSGKKVYCSSCFDLNDLEAINCIKFDMLGLATLSEIKELEKLSKHVINEDDFEDEKIYEYFRNGKTDGIFQMEKSTPKKILSMIECDSINDVIAVNALNRPAPLQLKMHEIFARNKLSGNIDTNTPYYRYTKETYGTMLYQEQTVDVAQKLGHLTPEQSFDMLKIMKKESNLTNPEYIPVIEKMKRDFFAGCKSEGFTREQTADIWASMLIYGFNKGHSTGYAFISIKQMFYKIYYPTFFWYVKIKYARNDADLYKLCKVAVQCGVVIFLPHVNYTALTSTRKKEGEDIIQQGLVTIKDVGLKASEEIENELRKNGQFKDKADFLLRCKSQRVNAKVIRALEENGALEFNWKKYLARVVKYNSTMAVRR